MNDMKEHCKLGREMIMFYDTIHDHHRRQSSTIVSSEL